MIPLFYLMILLIIKQKKKYLQIVDQEQLEIIQLLMQIYLNTIKIRTH